MRIFVSYARVDKPYCVQIVDTLNAHEVWYDARLYAGQGWWNEILRRLDWCEGFVYLLSPDSIGSEYCRREFQLAKSLGRHIFPILIHPNTTVPNGLSEIQYIDMSTGLTAENVKVLLDSIYIAENRRFRSAQKGTTKITAEDVKPPRLDMARFLEEVAGAMENGNYDKAVFLLEQAKTKGFRSKYFNIDQLLNEAQESQRRISYMREAEREYRQIAALVRHKSTNRLGCEAFKAFQQDFPDYDPEGIIRICAGAENGHSQATVVAKPQPRRRRRVPRPGVNAAQRQMAVPAQAPAPEAPPTPIIPMLEWCEIPAGIVKIDNPDNGQGSGKPLHVEAFRIAKYPVTNLQYQMFLDDQNGYANPQWWRFSRSVYEWRIENPEPHPTAFKGDERPREMVNWYDALAFCNWLGDKLSMNITLPTVEQRQRAIQGDDDRLFPWGNTFDKNRCNTRESEIKMSTLVTRYPSGVSPYGVYDLVGNVWEWCLNLQYDEREESSGGKIEMRAVHGGSFVSPCQRAEVAFRYYLNPQIHYASIGFRVVHNP